MRRLIITGEKACNRCGAVQPLEAFSKNKSCSDGRYSICKPCKKVTHKKWMARPEVYRAQRASSAERSKKNKVHRNQRRKERYRANPRRELDRNKIWDRANAERCKEIKRAWLKKNRAKSRAIVARRRARRLAAVGFYTPTDVRALFASQAGKCACCNRDISKYYEVDHIVPLVRGGSNWPDNLQLLCRRCNRSKSCKMPGDWEKYRQNQAARA
jgi:5-methylcytosine-specific restriction endonuclease McrA